MFLTLAVMQIYYQWRYFDNPYNKSYVAILKKNNSINDTHFSFIDDIEISDSNGNLKCNASCTVATSKDLTNLNINLRKDNYSDVLKKLNDNSKLFIRNK